MFLSQLATTQNLEGKLIQPKVFVNTSRYLFVFYPSAVPEFSPAPWKKQFLYQCKSLQREEVKCLSLDIQSFPVAK